MGSRLRTTVLPWYVEMPLLLGAYLAFGSARAAIDRGDPAATRDGVLVQRLERSLGIAVEVPPTTRCSRSPSRCT